MKLIEVSVKLWDYNALIGKMGLVDKTMSVVVSKIDGECTMSLLDKGGPIISNKSLVKLKKEFSEALKVSTAIRNLMYFKEVTK